jgi:hypothetical protein
MYKQNSEPHPAPYLPRDPSKLVAGQLWAAVNVSVTSSSSQLSLLQRPSHLTQSLLIWRQAPSSHWGHSHCSSGQAGLEFLEAEKKKLGANSEGWIGSQQMANKYENLSSCHFAGPASA